MFKNSRLQGASGVGAAIAYFTMLGFPVSVPSGDVQRYDLVVEMDGVLCRVEVKTATQKRASGRYVVGLRTHGGNRSGSTITRLDPTGIDYLFVLCGEGATYLVPAAQIQVSNSLTLLERWRL